MFGNIIDSHGEDTGEKTVVVEGEDENEISFRSDADVNASLALDGLRLERFTNEHNRRFETKVTTAQVASIVQMVQENQMLNERLEKKQTKLGFNKDVVLQKITSAKDAGVEHARDFYQKAQTHFQERPLLSSVVFLVAVAFLCVVLPVVGVGLLAAAATAFATACWSFCIASIAAAIAVSIAVGVLSFAGFFGSSIFVLRFVRRFLFQQAADKEGLAE